MRKLSFIALLLWSLCGHAQILFPILAGSAAVAGGAAPQIVQSCTGPATQAVTTTTNLTCTLTGVSTSNTIVILYGIQNDNINSTTPCDNLTGVAGTCPTSSNTYTSQFLENGGGNWGCRIQTAPVTTGGTLFFYLKGNTTFSGATVYEVSGVQSGVIDGAAVGVNNSTATNATVAMTATTKNDLLMQIIVSHTDNIYNSPQTGWSNSLNGTTLPTVTNLKWQSAVQTNAVAGSYTAGWPAVTVNNSRANFVCAVAIKGT